MGPGNLARMERYSHTQQSPMWMLVVVPVLVVIGFSLLAGEDGGATAVIALSLLLIAAVVVVFSRLSVSVDEQHVVLAFGAGWPKKRIELSTVTAATPVRNTWWYGFGIHRIPGGWMWNVWGLDAVELALADGKTFRIGTDEPAEVVRALSHHIPQA